MKPTLFLWIWIVLVILLSSCENQTAERQPPNIVFIFTDDQTYSSIGALGNDEIHTPHLDALVNKGVTFTHAYNMGGWNGAICMASRAMIVSGRYIWDAHRHKELWRQGDRLAMSQTWGQLMKEHGYKTYMSGKWHVDISADEVWDTVRHVRPGMPQDAFVADYNYNANRIRKRYNEGGDIKEVMPIGYSRPTDEHDNNWVASDTAHGGYWQGGLHWSEVLKKDALDFIKDAGQQEDPFFMYLAFNAPHDPRQAPQEYLDMYPLEDISVPESFLPEYPDNHLMGSPPWLRDEALAPYPRTTYAVKKHLKEYYAIISHVDQQIGEIIAALEGPGLGDTYIMFTSDHGLAVGKHGLIGKQNMYDHSIRVPLIIAGPDIPKGETRKQDVYLQDVMPTSLDFAGIERPDYVSFSSLLPLIEEENVAAPYKEIYGAYTNTQRMIRKNGYKLIVYPEIPRVRLYHLSEDPHEVHDLIGIQDKAHEKLLFKDLIALQVEMKDTLNLQPLYDQLYEVQ